MKEWHIDVVADEEYLHLKIVGKVTAVSLPTVVDEMMGHFDQSRHKGMLTDAMELELPFSPGQTYFNMQKLRQAGFGQLPKWALVTPDYEKGKDQFRDTTAQNTGINLQCFHSVAEAAEWIMED